MFAVMAFTQTAMAASKAPKKIKLNKTKVTMYVGDTKTLKTTFTPSKAGKSVKWTSSNKKVATVTKKGRIKALKAGKTVITCTSKLNKKVKVKCRVTVKKPVKTKSIKLSDSSILLDIGYSYKLKAKVSPSTATYKTVKWKSSDKSVVTVSSSGKCVGVAPGEAVITCYSEKYPAVKAKCRVEVMKPRNVMNDEELLEKFELILSHSCEPMYLKLQGQSVSSKRDSCGDYIYSIDFNANGTVKYIDALAGWVSLGSTYCQYSASPYITFGGKPDNAMDIRDSVRDGTYDFANDPDEVKIGWFMWAKDESKANLEKMINGRISNAVYDQLISYRNSTTANLSGGSVVIVYGKNPDGVLTGRYAGLVSYNMSSNASYYAIIGVASDNEETYGKVLTGNPKFY